MANRSSHIDGDDSFRNYCRSVGVDPTGLTFSGNDIRLLNWMQGLYSGILTSKGITTFTTADDARPIVDKNIILYGAGDRYLQLQWWDGITGRPTKP